MVRHTPICRADEPPSNDYCFGWFWLLWGIHRQEADVNQQEYWMHKGEISNRLTHEFSASKLT